MPAFPAQIIRYDEFHTTAFLRVRIVVIPNNLSILRAEVVRNPGSSTQALNIRRVHLPTLRLYNKYSYIEEMKKILQIDTYR